MASSHMKQNLAHMPRTFCQTWPIPIFGPVLILLTKLKGAILPTHWLFAHVSNHPIDRNNLQLIYDFQWTSGPFLCAKNFPPNRETGHLLKLQKHVLPPRNASRGEDLESMAGWKTPNQIGQYHSKSHVSQDPHWDVLGVSNADHVGQVPTARDFCENFSPQRIQH